MYNNHEHSHSSSSSSSGDDDDGLYDWNGWIWAQIVVQTLASIAGFFEYGRMLRKHQEIRWYSLRAMILFSCGLLMLVGMLQSVFNNPISIMQCLPSSIIGSLYHTVFHSVVYLLVLYYFWQIYAQNTSKTRSKYLWIAIPLVTVGLIVFCCIGHYLSCKPPNPEPNGSIAYQSLVLIVFLFFFCLGLGFFYLIRIRLGNIILMKEHHFLSNRFLGVILVYLPFFLGRIAVSIWFLAKGVNYSPDSQFLSVFILVVDTAPTVALIISFRFYADDLTKMDEKVFAIDYDQYDSIGNLNSTSPLINSSFMASLYTNEAD